MQSIIAPIQPFCDRSQTSLKEGSLKFYPLPLMALNFAEEVCKDHIAHHCTLLAEFPVAFKSLEVEWTVCHNHTVGVPLSHIDALQMLHEGVELALTNHFYIYFWFQSFHTASISLPISQHAGLLCCKIFL